jgi:hypothetical protein
MPADDQHAPLVTPAWRPVLSSVELSTISQKQP